MVPVLSLWLPILLSAVLVFAASSLIHMVLGYHANDFGKVPAEDALRADMLRIGIPPGEYAIPHAASMKEMGSPEYVDKMKQGPVAFLTVRPGGAPAMGKTFVQWFLFCVAVGIFAAYVAGRAHGPGAAYLDVFRFVGTTAFVGYAVALWQNSIWYARSWKITLKSTFDGLVYALLTAGTFGWLWPG